MVQIPDHPVIRETERTGYAHNTTGVYDYCDYCSGPILKGDTYYSIFGQYFCADCVESFNEVVQ